QQGADHLHQRQAGAPGLARAGPPRPVQEPPGQDPVPAGGSGAAARLRRRDHGPRAPLRHRAARDGDGAHAGAMVPASVAGRLPGRPRLPPSPPRRPRPPGYRAPLTPPRLPLGGLAVSVLGHVLVLTVVAGVLMWTTWTRPKLYVVNLVPAVAAVG